jgi:hypothetical protein
MELWSEARTEWTLDLDDKSKFKVVVIYEDGPTGRRAKHFYDTLVQELEDECAFSLQLWNFQVLAIPELRESAIESAAQADFVILSLHGKAGLPVHIRKWIETWSKLIIGKGPALIALIDKSTTRGGTKDLALAYLKRVAKRTEVDFFGHTFLKPAGNWKGTRYEQRIDREQKAAKRRKPVAFSRPNKGDRFGRVRRARTLRQSYTVR